MTRTIGTAILRAVALSFLYWIIRRAVDLVRLRRMDSLAKDAEILVLRQQLAVLRRQMPDLGSRGPIALSSQAWLSWCPVSAGRRSWSAQVRSCAGTGRSSAGTGPTRIADQDVRLCRRRQPS